MEPDNPYKPPESMPVVRTDWIELAALVLIWACWTPAFLYTISRRNIQPKWYDQVIVGFLELVWWGSIEVVVIYLIWKQMGSV